MPEICERADVALFPRLVFAVVVDYRAVLLNPLVGFETVERGLFVEVIYLRRDIARFGAVERVYNILVAERQVIGVLVDIVENSFDV